jgi:PKD repeat protein
MKNNKWIAACLPAVVAACLLAGVGLPPSGALSAIVTIDTTATRPSVAVDGVPYSPAAAPADAPVNSPKAPTPAPDRGPAAAGGKIAARVGSAGLPTFFDGRDCVAEAQRTGYAWTWDFGDGSPTRPGFNAAHIYDKAGTYTVTLQLLGKENAPSVSPPLRVSMSVRIPASTRRIINIPAGVDLSQYNRISNVELVLDKGTYTAARGLTLARNVVMRGAGADTLIHLVAPQGMTVKGDCRISNLTIDYPAAKLPPSFGSATVTRGQIDAGAGMALYPQGSGIAIDHVTFLNVAYGVNGNRKPDDVLVEGCSAPLINGLRGYLTWVEGGAWCIYDNTVANPIVEHCIRCESDSGPLAICGNTLANLGTADSGVPGDAPKGAIVLHYTHDAYVAGNTVRTYGDTGGGIGAGPLMQTFIAGNPERTRRTVIEGNKLIDAPIRLDPGAEDTAIRDNTFSSGTAADKDWPLTSAIIIRVDDRGRSVRNLVIAGNTKPASLKSMRITMGTPAGLVSDWGAGK